MVSLNTYGKAVWVDRADNWRSADTDWVQDRLVLRYAGTPSTAPGVGSVYYDTATNSLMVQTATTVASCVAAAANLKVYPGTAPDTSVTVGHKTSTGLGLVIDSTGKLTAKPSIATVNETVLIDATGITVHTTPATTAKLTTDATTLHSDKPISASSFQGNIIVPAVGGTTSAGALTATTGTFNSNLSVVGTSTFTGNTDLSSAELSSTLTFTPARRGQHINMYTTAFGMGIQDNTLYFRSGGTQFKFYVGGSHADAPSASVVTIDSNSLDVVGSITASGTLAVNNVLYSGTVIHAGGNGPCLRLIDTSYSGTGTNYDVYMEFYGGGTGVTTTAPGTRSGYIGYPGSTTMTLANLVDAGQIRLTTTGAGPISFAPGPGGDLNLTAGATTGEIMFSPQNIFRGKMSGNGFLWGKAAADVHNAGIEMYGTGGSEGQIQSTTSAVTNLYLHHISTVDANAKAFVQFLRGTTTQLISEIYQVKTTAGVTTGVHFSNMEYDAPSDYRLKDDLGPISGALDRVMELQPKRYRLKGDENVVEGFIAHEAMPVVPYLVRGEKDAVDDEGQIVSQGFNYAGLTPLLAAAIQELKGRVDAMESAA